MAEVLARVLLVGVRAVCRHGDGSALGGDGPAGEAVGEEWVLDGRGGNACADVGFCRGAVVVVNRADAASGGGGRRAGRGGGRLARRSGRMDGHGGCLCCDPAADGYRWWGLGE